MFRGNVSTLLLVAVSVLQLLVPVYTQPCSQNSNCPLPRACLIFPTQRQCTNTNLGGSCSSTTGFPGSYDDHGACLSRDTAPSPCDGESCLCDTQTGNCKCNTGYTGTGPTGTTTMCLKNLQYNEQCNNAAYIICPTAADCISGICECPAGFVYDQTNNECLPVADNGDPCTKSVQCTEQNSECSNSNLCSCKSSHPILDSINGICLETKLHGESCSIDDQCTDDVTGAECDTFCQCPTKFVLNLARDECLEEGDDPCIEDVQCILQTSICATNMCDCDTGYYNGSAVGCFPEVDFLETCVFDDQCLPSSLECRTSPEYMYKRCLCPSSTPYAVSSVCFADAALGTSCTGIVDRCDVFGATCGVTNCECAGTTTTLYMNSICLEDRALFKGCLDNDQCASSLCTSNHCACPANTCYFEKSGGSDCLTDVAFGAPCNNDYNGKECTTVHSQCSTNCACIAGYVQNTPGEDICLEGGLTFGKACEIPEQCAGPLICPSGRCFCASGFIFDDITCKASLVAFSTPRDSLRQCLTQCSDPAATSCLCKSGHVHDSTANVCYQVSVKFGSCKVTGQCPTGFVCLNNKCVCPMTMKYSSTTDTCLTIGQCNSDDTKVRCGLHNAACNSIMTTNCECASGFILVSGECIKGNVDFQGGCTADAQCNVPDSKRKCSSKRCTCMDNYVYCTDTSMCIKEIEFGNGCVTNKQCKTVYSECSASTCACAATLVHDSVDDICRPKALINEQCLKDLQCISEAECMSKMCMCKDGYVFDVGTKTCLIVRTSNTGTCSADVQCHYLQGACVSSTCGCKSGTTYIAGKGCLCSDREISEACDEGGQCGPANSECPSSSSTCACKAGFIYDPISEDCLVEAGFGVACTIASQCTTESANCISSCACPTGQSHDAGNNRCLIDVNEHGEACVANTQCKGSLSCLANRCKCPAGQIIDTGTTCLTLLAFGAGPCTDMKQCNTDGATCVGNMCSCASSEVHCTTPDSCFRKDLGNDEACICDGQCSTKDAKCKERGVSLKKRCRCDDKYVIESGANTCLPEAAVGAPCSAGVQCSSSNGECMGNPSTCQCSSTDVEVTVVGGTFCIKARDFDFSCSYNEQCTSDDSNRECTSNRCQCIGSYRFDHMIKKCVEAVPFKGVCVSAVQCQTKCAICDDVGKCDCDDDMVYNAHSDSCIPDNLPYATPCLDDDQCGTPLATCQSDLSSIDRCLCISPLIFVVGSCLPAMLSIGDTCVSRAQCGTKGGVDCLNGRCLCRRITSSGPSFALGDYFYDRFNDNCIYINFVENLSGGLPVTGPTYALPSVTQRGFEYMGCVTVNLGSSMRVTVTQTVLNSPFVIFIQVFRLVGLAPIEISSCSNSTCSTGSITVTTQQIDVYYRTVEAFGPVFTFAIDIAPPPTTTTPPPPPCPVCVANTPCCGFCFFNVLCFTFG